MKSEQTLHEYFTPDDGNDIARKRREKFLPLAVHTTLWMARKRHRPEQLVMRKGDEEIRILEGDTSFVAILMSTIPKSSTPGLPSTLTDSVKITFDWMTGRMAPTQPCAQSKITPYVYDPLYDRIMDSNEQVWRDTYALARLWDLHIHDALYVAEQIFDFVHTLQKKGYYLQSKDPYSSQKPETFEMMGRGISCIIPEDDTGHLLAFPRAAIK